MKKLLILPIAALLILGVVQAVPSRSIHPTANITVTPIESAPEETTPVDTPTPTPNPEPSAPVSQTPAPAQPVTVPTKSVAVPAPPPTDPSDDTTAPLNNTACYLMTDDGYVTCPVVPQ